MVDGLFEVVARSGVTFHPVEGLEPNSPLREAVTALAQPARVTAAPTLVEPIPPDAAPAEPMHHQATRNFRALLLARMYELLPLLCPQCGGAIKIIAFFTEALVIREILGHLGEPTSPLRLLRACGPSLWEMPGNDPSEADPPAEPQPDDEFD